MKLKRSEGYYRMASTFNLSPGIRLVGAGADKTILYREPGRFFSQPLLRVNGEGNAPDGTQVSDVLALQPRGVLVQESLSTRNLGKALVRDGGSL